jgi:methionine S-methyltransferase
VNEFLKQCQLSSHEASESFKALLAKLESPASRGEALRLLHNLFETLLNQKTSDEMMSLYHFSFSELKLKNMRLLLLRLPSTFCPEEWSFTFYEGLSRYKTSEFEDRKVIELGCGIGWISLALAMQTKPKKIYGLDINPKAVMCARINLYLNAYNKNAESLWQSGGQNLDEVVEFHVSDLFEYFRHKDFAIDRVIGCIPQVLNPDPEFTTQMLQGDLSEDSSDEFLHSLSNYAPQQGQIEDQFGLGLIAKAVEDSVYVLKNSGKIILNLGGRPGKKVLEKLFLRRGFAVRQVWQTQVEQAKDTDIRALVEIEKKSTHRFEFYIEEGGDTPISAHTALSYAMAGGRISHGLLVYEARLRDPAHLPQIIKTLEQKGFEDARSAIDLSYPEDSLFEEKASFLSALSMELQKSDFFPYQKTSGFEVFRKNLSLFFKNYFRIDLAEENFVITPSRLITCRNIIAIYKPKRILIDLQLASNYLTDCEEIIEIPQGSDLLCEMIAKLKPDLVFYAMPEAEARTSDSLLRIIEVSAQSRTRVIIDISDFFELSSSPPHNGVFRYLENHELPVHISLMCGLVKNKIYSDLQVAFVISGNDEFLESLINAAELTYSRTPFLSQFYYNCILNDLLSFQVFDTARKLSRNSRKPRTTENAKFIPLATSTVKAFSNPAIIGERQAQEATATQGLLRLDYGENCLAAPTALKQFLFEAFAHQSIPIEDCDPGSEIIRSVAERWALSKTSDLTCVLSGGVAPIFSELAQHCARTQETMLFPSGSYGYFVACAEFHDAPVQKLNTDPKRAFKIDLESLKKTLAESKTSTWIILSAPIVNPTGAIYTSQEIREIADIAFKNNAILVLDSIFSGLGFDKAKEMIASEVLGESRWLILGGVSKEFAAGGLRIGYGVTRDSKILTALDACTLSEPHKTLRFVLKKLYQGQNKSAADLVNQRSQLLSRALRLTEVLNHSGWEALPPQGGLFLIARPIGLIGKIKNGVTVTDKNVAQLLREQTGIVINSPDWIGIPGYFRFVLSVSESEFEKALVKLTEFFI